MPLKEVINRINNSSKQMSLKVVFHGEFIWNIGAETHHLNAENAAFSSGDNVESIIPVTAGKILYIVHKKRQLFCVVNNYQHQDRQPQISIRRYREKNSAPGLMMQSLYKLFVNGCGGTESHLLKLVEVIVDTVLDGWQQKQPKPLNLFDDIIFFLHNNLQAGLSREEIAELFKVSPGHISRLFKQKTGNKFSDYYVNLKIIQAKELLLNSRLKVKKVAQMCGFDNADYFGRVFRERTGITPGKYRKM